MQFNVFFNYIMTISTNHYLFSNLFIVMFCKWSILFTARTFTPSTHEIGTVILDLNASKPKSNYTSDFSFLNVDDSVEYNLFLENDIVRPSVT